MSTMGRSYQLMKSRRRREKEKGQKVTISIIIMAGVSSTCMLCYH